MVVAGREPGGPGLWSSAGDATSGTGAVPHRSHRSDKSRQVVQALPCAACPGADHVEQCRMDPQITHNISHILVITFFLVSMINSEKYCNGNITITHYTADTLHCSDRN